MQGQRSCNCSSSDSWAADGLNFSQELTVRIVSPLLLCLCVVIGLNSALGWGLLMEVQEQAHVWEFCATAKLRLSVSCDGCCQTWLKTCSCLLPLVVHHSQLGCWPPVRVVQDRVTRRSDAWGCCHSVWLACNLPQPTFYVDSNAQEESSVLLLEPKLHPGGCQFSSV